MIYLARHGETAYNAQRRFQGHLPVPLNDRGREQARELADAAAQVGYATLLCSPLARALETAEIVGERIGNRPIPDPRFAETDTGDWTDRTFEEIIAERPDAFEAWVAGDDSFRFPGGESFGEQRARVLEGIAEARHRPAPVLIVCHRGSMRLALGSPADLRESPIGNGALIPLP